ncbi:hypothetical protein GCM10008096_15190 [Zhihengliuella salsuginis]|uniref:Uncharacterized protein n=1 Tax=Zhihengliuella salsuginis TaxID=578222 RepID=A0ABQ3GHH8_9MICC|nr:hypothetical protein GCM10008096_15190 [Zhihengliuella salsuginis]
MTGGSRFSAGDVEVAGFGVGDAGALLVGAADEADGDSTGGAVVPLQALNASAPTTATVATPMRAIPN